MQALLEVSAGRSLLDMKQEKEMAHKHGYLDKFGRMLSKGQEQVMAYYQKRHLLERSARTILEDIESDETHRKVPYCGLALGLAKQRGWLAQDEDERLFVTETGAEILKNMSEAGWN